MDFKTEEWSIEKLLSIYQTSKLDLNPPYQRGDIWTLPAKKKLIDSIKLIYPLPLFFIRILDLDKFEMVDGQQRTRTILGYSKGLFPDVNRIKIDETDQDFFFKKYKISICLISNARQDEIEDFYFRVNKFGSKLNRPEILKAQYSNTTLQSLIEKISDSPEFESLQLFNLKSLDRLNDLDFIGELLTLTKYGITERKFTVDKFYEDKSFNESEAKILEFTFKENLDILLQFNEIYPIKNTRYRQRSDFYTLFGFINLNNKILASILVDFYKILIVIDNDISPSNDKCFALQDYAINCISLSHTEKSRKTRLRYFEELLLNKDKDPLKKGTNLTLVDVMTFYNQNDSDLLKTGDFYILDIYKLQVATNRKYF